MTDCDMLVMLKKGIRSGICHAIDQYAQANNKYMTDRGSKTCHISCNMMSIICMDGQMSYLM